MKVRTTETTNNGLQISDPGKQNAAIIVICDFPQAMVSKCPSMGAYVQIHTGWIPRR